MKTTAAVILLVLASISPLFASEFRHDEALPETAALTMTPSSPLVFVTSSANGEGDVMIDVAQTARKISEAFNTVPGSLPVTELLGMTFAPVIQVAKLAKEGLTLRDHGHSHLALLVGHEFAVKHTEVRPVWSVKISLSW